MCAGLHCLVSTPHWPRGRYSAISCREARQRRTRPPPIGAPATRRSADVVSGPTLLHPVGAVVLECDRATLAASGTRERPSKQERRVPGHLSHLTPRAVRDLECHALSAHRAGWGGDSERPVVRHTEGEVVPVGCRDLN